MITIRPNKNVEAVTGVPRCFEASSTMYLPQADCNYLTTIPTSGDNWTYSLNKSVWTKVSGVNGNPDAHVSWDSIYYLQPFHISGYAWSFTTPPAPNRFYEILVGIRDDVGRFSGFRIFKNCGNQSTSACNENNDNPNNAENWKVQCICEDIAVTPLQDISFREEVMLRSDGNSMYWYVWSNHTACSLGGTSYLRYSLPLSQLSETQYYKFDIIGLWIGNELTWMNTFKGSFSGMIPQTWYAPDGGILLDGSNDLLELPPPPEPEPGPGPGPSSSSSSGGSIPSSSSISSSSPSSSMESGSGSWEPPLPPAPEGGNTMLTNVCFLATEDGTYRVCVDNDIDEPVCVEVVVGPLYFEPIGLECGQCVWAGEVVNFRSNGMEFGTLEATGGTVLSPLSWRAPDQRGTYTITYTIEGLSESCTINVVPKFQLTNIKNNELRGLLPGDSFQLTTNFDAPYGQVRWTNLTCHGIVSEDGMVTIPNSIVTGCFGALDCTIRGELVEIDGETCPNLVLTDGQVNTFITVRIIVDPVYPTPDQGGPEFVKWKPETPEYNTVINDFEGGCDETYLKNRVATYRWTVRYAGLAQEVPCEPQDCCDNSQGFPDGVGLTFKSAKYLDDFWNFVYGNYAHFTLIEPRTGRIWRNVRFDGTVERDHINWRRVQSRDIRLIWKPCCDSEPAGGKCEHTVTYDPYAPSIPTNLRGYIYDTNWIKVLWNPSVDNVGVKGYEIWVTDQGADRSFDPLDVGNSLVYDHRTILEEGKTYVYRVRAYDFEGNRSAWSAPYIVTYGNIVVESGDPVEESGDAVIEG